MNIGGWIWLVTALLPHCKTASQIVENILTGSTLKPLLVDSPNTNKPPNKGHLYWTTQSAPMCLLLRGFTVDMCEDFSHEHYILMMQLGWRNRSGRPGKCRTNNFGTAC